MMQWVESSGRNAKFFNAQSDAGIDEDSLRLVLKSMLDFCSSQIVGRGNATRFDTMFFETNCDSGRLFLGVGTEEGRASGKLDGCSVYLKKLQDYWYDLDAKKLSSSKFYQTVDHREMQLAELFSQTLANQISTCELALTSSRLHLIAYGSGGEDDEVMFEKMYAKNGTDV